MDKMLIKDLRACGEGRCGAECRFFENYNPVGDDHIECSEALALLAADAIEELTLTSADQAPCKIGDAVFRIVSWEPRIEQGHVSMLQQKADGSWKFRVSVPHGVIDFPASAIGKTVFFSYTEAEAELNRRAGNV